MGKCHYSKEALVRIFMVQDIHQVFACQYLENYFIKILCHQKLHYVYGTYMIKSSRSYPIQLLMLIGPISVIIIEI